MKTKKEQIEELSYIIGGRVPRSKHIEQAKAIIEAAEERGRFALRPELWGRLPDEQLVEIFKECEVQFKGEGEGLSAIGDIPAHKLVTASRKVIKAAIDAAKTIDWG